MKQDIAGAQKYLQLPWPLRTAEHLKNAHHHQALSKGISRSRTSSPMRKTHLLVHLLHYKSPPPIQASPKGSVQEYWV